MKFILIALMFSISTLTLASQEQKSKKETSSQMGEAARKLMEDKPEEDCDEKAKKPIEIKEEEPVLGLGISGCSIDDM